MPRSARSKGCALSVRLSDADVAIIDRAAGLRARSRTDFVRTAAIDAAEDVLVERSDIRMSPDGFKALTKALSKPAVPIAEMIELLRRPSPWDTSPAPMAE